MTRKIEGERRRAGERKEEFDSRIKGLKLRVIVTARFFSQAPPLVFFWKIFHFSYGLDTFWEQKKRPIFFSFFFWYGLTLTYGQLILGFQLGYYFICCWIFQKLFNFKTRTWVSTHVLRVCRQSYL